MTISATVETTKSITIAMLSTVKPSRTRKSSNCTQSVPLLAIPPSPAAIESRCDSITKKKRMKTLSAAPTEMKSPPRGRNRPNANSTRNAIAGIAGRIQACSAQNT